MTEEKNVIVTKNYYGGLKHGGEAVYGLGWSARRFEFTNCLN